MTKNKDGSFRVIGIVFLITIIIAFNWNNWVWLKNSIHSAFDPTLGALLNWHLEIGMILILFVLSIIMTIVQKYTTNQEELKKIRYNFILIFSIKVFQYKKHHQADSSDFEFELYDQ